MSRTEPELERSPATPSSGDTDHDLDERRAEREGYLRALAENRMLGGERVLPEDGPLPEDVEDFDAGRVEIGRSGDVHDYDRARERRDRGKGSRGH